MSARAFQSGRDFRMRHTVLLSVVTIPGATLCVIYMVSLLRMTPEQWSALLEAVALCGVLLTVSSYWLQSRIEAPITRALDAERDGVLSQALLEEAFGRVAHLPRMLVRHQLGTWFVASLLVVVYMAATLKAISLFTLGVVVSASVSGGVLSSSILLFLSKWMASPLFHAWAAQIPDRARREQLVRPVSLLRKLALPVGAVSVVTLYFALLLAYVMSVRPVEEQDSRVKQAFTGYAVEQLAEDASRLPTLRQAARKFHAADRLVIVDREMGRIVDGPDDGIAQHLAGAGEALEIAEVLWMLSTGEPSGDSRPFDSANSFAWRGLDAAGKRLLVAVTPEDQLGSGFGTSLVAFGLLVVFALSVTVATCWLVARDIGSTARRLVGAAERVAAGDLAEHGVVESDDELTRLAGAFGDMVVSLRAMIGRVAQTADGLESSARDLGEVGRAVTGATDDQRTGIEQATAQVASVNRRVSEISESAHALNSNIEEASSSILQLGAASEELNHTATTLNGHVEEVTGSIDQMIRSVGQVGESTDGLAHAVSETTSSMSEMAATMADVDANASETARLSARVVELAERGQERVHETISGMDAIREATDTAEMVIRGLTGRMREIGAIVDVIDDVADETNLLALNAAIIAAQAGDQGRGFSVVAEEIKDLADRVLSSTKEIGDLIRAVQGESANAEKAIGRGSTRVQSGVEIAAEAGLALEEITAAARDSGARIEEIVHAVREQSGAARHVATLMEQVNAQVEEIRRAGREQMAGNEVIKRTAHVTRDVAHQTQRTTEEQSRGANRIRQSMESIRDAVERIQGALQEQTESCRVTVSSLEQVFERTRSNRDSSQRLERATEELTGQAQALRQDMKRFRIEPSPGDTA